MKLKCLALLMMFYAQVLSAKNVGDVQHAINRARVHTELAQQYFRVGQISVAVDEAKIALSSSDAYAPAHAVLAMIYAQLRKPDLATPYFKEALRLTQLQGESATELRSEYAWFLCGNRQWAQALQEYSLVLTDPVYGKMPQALTNVGICSARMGQLDLAQSYLNAAVDMNEPSGQAYLYRAHIFISMTQYDAATSDLQKATQIAPESAQLAWLDLRLAHALHAADFNAKLQNLTVTYPVSEPAAWAQAGAYEYF
jgi:type IV pilus assembly protein PilF